MNFYLPDFYFNKELNLYLIDLMQLHPEYFYNDICIKAVYGSFPGTIWNGGRQIPMKTISRIDIDNIIKEFNDRNIGLNFTFTNFLLEENHVYDSYCNLIAELAHNNLNSIIINSPILETHLRQKYPNFNYILSTTKCERNVEAINNCCEKYDLVVPDYRDVVNPAFLASLKYPNKIELLVNAYCNPACKLREKHYYNLSYGQLHFTRIHDETLKCPTRFRSFLESLNFPTVLKVEDIYGKYKDMGFTNFKIEGRLTHVVDVIESYVYYLVKPEHKDNVRCLLLKNCNSLT